MRLTQRLVTALGGLALVVCLAPTAVAVTQQSAVSSASPCQKALDDAAITQRNADTVNDDPKATPEDKAAAQNEADMAATTAQRVCDSTELAS
jgi:hypothetical protein